MLGVLNGIADDLSKEGAKHDTSFLVNERGDTLYATTAGETADGRLRDALDVVTKDFAVALGAALSKSFSTFSTARHLI